MNWDIIYHVFSESEEDDVDACADTDYCTDTYTYDRKAYETWVKALVEQNGPISFEDLARRHDCVQNIDFTSRNIMDYPYLQSTYTGTEERVDKHTCNL